jgi:hypothetical protein
MMRSSTSEAVSFLTETVEPEIDLSEVLLDLDLMEDLLELFFGVSVDEVSCNSVSGCVLTFNRSKMNALVGCV